MGSPLENDWPGIGNGRLRLLATVAGLLVAVTAAIGMLGPVSEASAAKSLTIYKNRLNTEDKKAEITRFNRKDRCVRKAMPTAIRVSVGKQTRECFMRIPVVGKNVEISAIGRLFKSTPKAIRGRTYLGLSVRQSGDGSRYELAVFPAARKFQLRKILPDGAIEVLGSGKAGNVIKGVGKANRMTLKAFNGVDGAPSSTARLVASVNGKRLAFTDDVQGSSLAGTATTFSVGSSKVAKGALGSFTSLVARIPDPFA